MTSSILETITKMLGDENLYDAFSTDIIIHINSAFMILNQLGVGPETPFIISGTSETWKNFLGDSKDFEAVKTYVYLKVKTVFDPPSTSYVLDCMKEQIKELEFRLNVNAERR